MCYFDSLEFVVPLCQLRFAAYLSVTVSSREDDLARELEELGLVDDKEQKQKQSEQLDKQETPVLDDKGGAEEQPKEATKSGGGKKGKKKKKNEAW